MIFRNIVFSAVVVGIVAGTLYGIFQQIQISPIIYAAEVYEVTESGESISARTPDTTEGTGTKQEAWAPEQGFERILSTLAANILAAIAYSILLISLMSLHNLKSTKLPITWKTGIFWGIGLMLAIFVVPAVMGLHPEIPGTVAQPLENRQIWWISSVVATAAGLLILYYASSVFKLGGLVLMALPALAVPSMDSLGFINTDPAAVDALSKLTGEFVIMTSIGMVIFCILLGALSGFASARFVRFG